MDARCCRGLPFVDLDDEMGWELTGHPCWDFEQAAIGLPGHQFSRMAHLFLRIDSLNITCNRSPTQIENEGQTFDDESAVSHPVLIDSHLHQ